jgi:hypothetical protein
VTANAPKPAPVVDSGTRRCGKTTEDQDRTYMTNLQAEIAAAGVFYGLPWAADKARAS